MNETLTVRDFGPIREATVEFKRVTVFIGPTGGGKSTLAKLAAIWRSGRFAQYDSSGATQEELERFGITNCVRKESVVEWKILDGTSLYLAPRRPDKIPIGTNAESQNPLQTIQELTEEIVVSTGMYEKVLNEVIADLETRGYDKNLIAKVIPQVRELYNKNLYERLLHNALFSSSPSYIPAERVFYSAVSSSLAGLMRDDIGLPKPLLDFVNDLWQARKEVTDLDLPMFNVKYEYRDDQDKIRLADREESLRLGETASGIQSVAPLLVLLEYLSRQTERPQSFIVEEPELNLFPEAQQALLQTLIEKCTAGENDLIITTHSPYVLTVLNTLMYAHKVAHEVPENAPKVAKLIPRKYWVDPAQFAAYYVDLPTTKKKQQVRSIVDRKTGMIGENELDNISFTLADLLGKLLALRTPPRPKATAAAAAAK